MNKIKQPALLGTAAFLTASIFAGGAVNAQSVDLTNADAIADYANFGSTNDSELDAAGVLGDSMGQVTNVNQLRDVAPTDWAYEALRSLVDRYGCISGFPNQTYRGNQPLSRYEFAAGLNSCLNQIERLIASGGSSVEPADLESVERLSQEFEGELAGLGGRVDEIESRTAIIEDNQFSTTTKLVGEVAFQIAGAFGDEQAAGLDNDGAGIEGNPDLDSEIVFTDKVRLQLVSSFTGKDKLFTRLSAGNLGASFQGVTGTREGRFAHDGFANNDVTIDRLHYSFPVGENLKVTTMAVLGAHHFYAETFNSGLNTGGGASGALTRFGERNPIYRLGIATSSAGIGGSYKLGDLLRFDAGYIAPGAAVTARENGITGGSFSAMGQVTLQPLEKLKVGATYVRSYDTAQASGVNRPPFLWGGTGTNAANLVSITSPVATDSFGAQFQFDVSEKLSVRGWGAYTDANIINGGDGNNGSAEIWNYAAAFVVSDVIKEGNLAALIVGAEPYLTSIDADGVNGDEEIEADVPIHLEALYKYQFIDNISVTPGIIWLPTPNQDGDNSDIFIGT
ncbi:MAG: iron uptake porin, partial [Cyanobacteria bacterium J06623_7]